MSASDTDPALSRPGPCRGVFLHRHKKQTLLTERLFFYKCGIYCFVR